MYLNVRQTAERWGISERRVRLLCAEGRVSVPCGSVLPATRMGEQDGRTVVGQLADQPAFALVSETTVASRGPSAILVR